MQESSNNPHTDMLSGDWIDRQLAPWMRPYARLMRLDRPVGTWLLLLPCWWGIALAGGAFPDLWLMTLFGAGAVAMRGAGCVINDMFDRDFDRRVERTRSRPLASGSVSMAGAGALLAFLLLCGLAVLAMLNGLAVSLGLAILPVVLLYPLAKRVTWWPQLVLGLAFNWGAVMGWAAARGEIEMPAALLYLAGIFWTLGYDTIYAHQDKRDDAAIGVKSLALRLGKDSRRWIMGFYAACLVFLAAAGIAANAGWGMHIGLGAAALHLSWQIDGWKMDDPKDCLKRFRSNRDFGLLVLLAIMAGKIA